MIFIVDKFTKDLLFFCLFCCLCGLVFPGVDMLQCPVSYLTSCPNNIIKRRECFGIKANDNKSHIDVVTPSFTAQC